MSDWLRKLNIPFIVDIKDQWPDVIVDAFPSHLRFIGKLLLFPYYYMAKKIISNAAAITSMSDSFINWSVKFQNKNLTQINRVIPLVPSKNSFIDNLVQIAHNVCIGEEAIIASQVGIAGSTKIGNNVVIGGQAGIAGHLTIGNNIQIAAKSGVTKNISDNSIVAGFPAVDIKRWKISNIKLNRL